MNNNIAIILAGGSGERFGEKKQFINLAGKTLWKHVYDKAIKILPKKNIVIVGETHLGFENFYNILPEQMFKIVATKNIMMELVHLKLRGIK